jgi:hypothetical protein
MSAWPRTFVIVMAATVILTIAVAGCQDSRTRGQTYTVQVDTSADMTWTLGNRSGRGAGEVNLPPGAHELAVKAGGDSRRYPIYLPPAPPESSTKGYKVKVTPDSGNHFLLVQYPYDLMLTALGLPYGWAPDGRWLLSRGGYALLVDPQRNELRALDGVPAEISWAPGGERMAYRLSEGVRVARPDGSGAEAVVTAPPKEFLYSNLFWLDDQRLLVQVSGPLGVSEYLLVDLENQKPPIRISGVRQVDGRQVAYLVEQVLSPSEVVCLEAVLSDGGNVVFSHAGICGLPDFTFTNRLAGTPDRSYVAIRAFSSTWLAALEQAPGHPEGRVQVHNSATGELFAAGLARHGLAWGSGQILVFASPGTDSQDRDMASIVIYSATERRELARWSPVQLHTPFVAAAPNANDFWVGGHLVIEGN